MGGFGVASNALLACLLLVTPSPEAPLLLRASCLCGSSTVASLTHFAWVPLPWVSRLGGGGRLQAREENVLPFVCTCWVRMGLLVQEDVTKRRAELIREAERDRAELVALREEMVKLRAENRRAVRGEVSGNPTPTPNPTTFPCRNTLFGTNAGGWAFAHVTLCVVHMCLCSN